MRYLRPVSCVALALTAHLFAQTTGTAPQPFTLEQVLSAPYSTDLTAAPVGNLFAWVEDSEGRHNLYVGGPNTPARALTHNTEDDGQDISALAWSPDGTQIAYVYGAAIGADGKPANPAHLQRLTPVRVMLVNVSGHDQPSPIAEGRAPLFTRDRHALLFTHDGQIWTTCLQACTTEHAEGTGLPFPAQLASHQLVYDRGSASALTLSPDGNTLAFISRRREANQPSHSFLALYDLRKETLSFPAPSTGDDSAPAFSPDGKQLAWIRNPFTEIREFANPRSSATPWSIQLLDVANGTTRTVYSPEPNKPGSVLPSMSTGEPPLFFTAYNHLVFASEADGWVMLYTLDPALNKPPDRVRSGNFEVETPSISPDGRHIVFTTSAEAYQAFGIHVMEMNIGVNGWNSEALMETDMYHFVQQPETIVVEGVAKQTNLAPVCCHYVTRPKFGADGTLAALVSNALYPTQPAVFHIEGEGKKIDLLMQQRSATYPASSLVAPQGVEFTSSDGLGLHGQLFLPQPKSVASPQNQAHATRPAIIFVHGGPKRQMLLGYPGMDYYSNAYAMNQYLTSRGFIVLSVNYRCGIGYGLEFRACQQAGADGGTEYNDVLAAQKYLASRPDVDAKRIGIWGGSYGGYLTALALSRNSDLFAAGVDFHGVHDWNLEDNAADWKRGSFAQQDAIAAKALASSPLADLSKWHSPILLIHGDNDPNVAYAQTPLLADALRARNAALPKDQQVDVEELIFPDELHEFVLHKTWLAAYTAAAAFFERTLKP